MPLLVAGLVAAGTLHYLVRYRHLEGFDGLLARWAAGAWLGSPVLGHWPKGLQVENVYIFTALTGAFASAFLITLNAKAPAKTLQGLKVTEEKAAAPPVISRAKPQLGGYCTAQQAQELILSDSQNRARLKMLEGWVPPTTAGIRAQQPCGGFGDLIDHWIFRHAQVRFLLAHRLRQLLCEPFGPVRYPQTRSQYRDRDPEQAASFF